MVVMYSWLKLKALKPCLLRKQAHSSISSVSLSNKKLQKRDELGLAHEKDKVKGTLTVDM